MIMTSTESVQVARRANDSAKKSPLKVVSPIIKKYSGHRQGKIKKKLKFPRILSKQKNQIKPQLKTILPKTNAGDFIILEPELLPCALNLQKKKRKIDESENGNESLNEQAIDLNGKNVENNVVKENSIKVNKPTNKKKVKCLKNIEACLELLKSGPSSFKEKKELAYAENYLMKVQQRLKGKDEILYNQFMDLLCDFQTNGLTVCDVYKKTKSMFSSYPDLSEDFIAFLTAEQAVECGVFMDYFVLNIMTDFLNMVDIYFAKSPQQIKKIYSVLESLTTKQNLTTECVITGILPLLKGNPVLRDYFMQLLPNGSPPENFLTDYEEIEYPEINSDVSDDEDKMEMVHLPEMEDIFGGDMCPCQCHQEKKFKLQGQHCISCSLKFINGKVFIQNGKLLRPAKIVFDDFDVNYHRERLAPKLYPKRSKKKHKYFLFKDNSSPTKSSNLSSDELKSDIEEDEKGRLKIISVKSPRISRKKSVSPKLNKVVLKDNFSSDSKTEILNAEEKLVCKKSLELTFVKDEEDILNDVKVEVESQKSTVNDSITFLSEAERRKSEKSPTCSKILDLPKIDFEENTCDIFQTLIGKVESESSEKLDNNNKLENQICEFTDKEQSHSPPVISIPESATALFTSSKPILSLLENLDDSKKSPILINDLKTKNIGPGSPNLILENEIINLEVKTNCIENNIPWKIEEDRVILQTLQVEENCEETFLKIGKNIPARSVEDIKKRFAQLMNILYEMKSKTSNG